MKSRKRWLSTFTLLAAFALIASACSDDGGDTTAAPDTTAGDTTAAPDTTAAGGVAAEDFKLGILLVGPEFDQGYSQAHFEGAQYAIEKLGLSEDALISLDFINPADNPGLTPEGVAADMISQGADLVIFNSDDMRDGAFAAAEQNPDVPMVWVSGDSAWTDGKDYRADLTNLSNVWGQMIFGKMISGCAAALTTQTGSIGYLGPLTNDETRRLVNSAYLGARYCYENYRGEDPDTLEFNVTYIGFWFEIPGVTLDATQVVNDLIDGGADVIMSGIDTTQALVRSGQRADAGEELWAIPYDYVDGCQEAPDICLGVPYFNWGPSYLEIAQSVIDGTYSAEWQWVGPDWDDLNNIDS
ncbi:MAG: BMP family ABC transporter substrate-binding protein, partial [Acidimicrobiia bacterium]|nr:BMP family ABC transporter substrate-binding protein [Acidimicrobiia bacterium]